MSLKLELMEAAAVDPFADCCDGDRTPSWLSPRISFSQDFAMISSRVSPEKRKWEQAIDDDYSAEFEFRMCNSRFDDPQQGETMLSADELFFNGKLRPLLLLPAQAAASDDLCLPWKSEGKSHSEHRSMARHMSFEGSRCSSLSLENARDTTRRACISLDNSRCSSPSRAPALPPAAPASPKSSSSKYSSKLKDFFKPKKLQPKEAPPGQLVRDNSVTSSCRLPISPRSFWPFSRSNSAGESKTTTPAVPALPRRSNSAGESKTTSSSLVPSKSDAVEATKTNGTSSNSAVNPPSLQGKRSHPPAPLSMSEGKKNNAACSTSSPPPNRDLDPVVSASQVLSSPCSPSVPPSSASISRDSSSETVLDKGGTEPEEIGVTRDSASCVPTNTKQSGHSSNTSDAGRDPRKGPVLNAARVRGGGSPGRVRRGTSSPARNFARGSPGRRGVWNGTGGKGNAGRIVLRNLERCSAGTKAVCRSQDGNSRDCWKGSDRPNSYPVSVRVTPVLNVAVYRGKTSKTRLFGFGSFFSRKQKPTPPINNWRNGA